DQSVLVIFFFFFQAEDGIRDATVTGVQTCALPISLDGAARVDEHRRASGAAVFLLGSGGPVGVEDDVPQRPQALQLRRFLELRRSEERRVGEEWRGRGRGVL